MPMRIILISVFPVIYRAEYVARCPTKHARNAVQDITYKSVLTPVLHFAQLGTVIGTHQRIPATEAQALM